MDTKGDSHWQVPRRGQRGKWQEVPTGPGNRGYYQLAGAVSVCRGGDGVTSVEERMGSNQLPVI